MAELARMRKSNLNSAIEDVDQIVDLLVIARNQVAAGAFQPALHEPARRIATDLRQNRTLTESAWP